jgi:CelD/BcsL family acetyltransferase involved in cellulose biosynthesis
MAVRQHICEAEIADWESDPFATPFQHPAFARAWFPLAQPGDAYECVEIPGGYVRYHVGPDRVARFDLPQDVADYLGPVGPAHRDIAHALVSAIAARSDWERADLTGLAADTGWPAAIADAATTSGFSPKIEAQDVCPRVDLSGGFDAYLAGLPSKERHEIGRKARRLERERGPRQVRYTTADTLDADLARFIALHRLADGEKGGFMTDEMGAFFGRLATAFLDLDALRLAWLGVGGEEPAAVWSFSMRGVWYAYNSAFDPSWRALSVGMVLMADCIEQAAREGCEVFDLLRGDEGYKYRLGAVDRALLRVTFDRGER